jgi:hypothetical protein
MSYCSPSKSLKENILAWETYFVGNKCVTTVLEPWLKEKGTMTLGQRGRWCPFYILVERWDRLTPELEAGSHSEEDSPSCFFMNFMVNSLFSCSSLGDIVSNSTPRAVWRTEVVQARVAELADALDSGFHFYPFLGFS